MQTDLTRGDLMRTMLRFSVPYLISCFLQTFYGMADLFITGQFNGADAVSAVAIGSQVMHMLTVMIVGLAMGTTVTISRALGAKEQKKAASYIGNSVLIFSGVALLATTALLLTTGGIIHALDTPREAVGQARDYLTICFIGVPLITAYNVVSSIFRGLGDTKRPMIFVALAGVINVGLDFLLIGPGRMGAAGAALATVISQGISVGMALISLGRSKDQGFHLTKGDFRPRSHAIRQILGIGVPITCQDGLIQISFLIITTIANKRGVDVAAAVGIVEKIISFLFLVPSAMLSTVSAVAAQNAGALKHDRGRKALGYGCALCVAFGMLSFLICQLAAPGILSLFVSGEPEVVRLGAQYLRSYVLDCIFAGIHFCFSGYFSAYGKSMYSFVHNIISIALVRIPGAYAASVLFPETLFPMGLAAPLGSALSALICLILYRRLRRFQISSTT